MPSLDHNIVNTHVEFCRLSIVFLAFVHWYRMEFDQSVKLVADDYRKRMQSRAKLNCEENGWKETGHMEFHMTCSHNMYRINAA